MSGSATKSMARNFSWLMFGGLVNGSLKFLIMVYAARVLQAEAFGLYNFAQAFLVYLILLVDSGLSIYGTREIAQKREMSAEITANLLAIRIISGLLIFAATMIVVILLPVSIRMQWLLLFSFLFLFCRALNLDWVFQGLGRMDLTAWSKIIYGLLSASLILWLVRSPADLLFLPAIQFVVGLVVALLFVIVLAKKVMPFGWGHVQPDKFLSIFWVALPLGATVILTQIYGNLDTIMLSFMDSAASVGYYNAAYQIYFAFLGLFVVWQTSAVPIVNQKYSRSKKEARSFVNKYLSLTLGAGIPLAFIVTLLAPPLIPLIFGPSYAPAIVAVQILIWSLVLVTVSSTYGILVLIPAGKFKELLVPVSAGAGLNIVLNFLLIPTYSFVGAAIATIAAEAIVCVFVVYVGRHVFDEQ